MILVCQIHTCVPSVGVLVMRGVDEAFDVASTLWQEKCVITGVEDCSSLFLGTINTNAKSSDAIFELPKSDEVNASGCPRKWYNCVRDSAGLVCISQGQSITLDGATGRILRGSVPQMEPAIDRDFTTLLQWTNKYRRVDILGSCDTANEVHDAMQFGAEGIGLLCIDKLYV
jgi:hypothetical protein